MTTLRLRAHLVGVEEFPQTSHVGQPSRCIATFRALEREFRIEVPWLDRQKARDLYYETLDTGIARPVLLTVTVGSE